MASPNYVKIFVSSISADIKTDWHPKLSYSKNGFLGGPGGVATRGGVEDTRLEAKAKDTKKIRGQGQGQLFRGQNLSRPRTGMLEAKANDQGHRRKRSPKKKKFSKFFFRRSPIYWRTQNF